MFCPSSLSDHHREIYNFHVNRLVKYPPRLQDPSLLCRGNWGGWWRQPASPGYPAVFQGCRNLVLALAQDLPVLDNELLPCLITAVQKTTYPIRVNQTRAQGREPQAWDHKSALHHSLALCCTSSCWEARWPFSSLWKTYKLEHRAMPTWMDYFCTSAYSHGPSAGFGTALPSVGVIDPGQLQHLCLGSCFHWDTLDAFSLPCLKSGQMSVLTPKGRKGALCLVIIVLSVLRSSIAKQQGNALVFVNSHTRQYNSPHFPTCFGPAGDSHLLSKSWQRFHCRARPPQRLLYVPKRWVTLLTSVQGCDCLWNVAVNIVNLNTHDWEPFFF